MNEIIAEKLKTELIFELNHLSVEPQYIIMSPDFYRALGKPYLLRGFPITIDSSAKRHWEFKL